MSFFDRLLGRKPTEPAIRPNTLRTRPRSGTADPDALAVDRYRYLLRTAPPEQLEAAHAEAFSNLTPEQREMARRDLGSAVGPGEAPASDSPQDLARAATRAEARDPGTLERTFSGGTAPGMGGSFLQTFAAVFIATSVADALFGTYGAGPTEGTAEGEPAGEGDPAGLDGQVGPESGDLGDMGGGGDLGGDFGGGFGDFGGFDI